MKKSIIDNLGIIDFAQKSKDFDIFDNKEYGFIQVYGNESQPALFLKKVDSFDANTLKSITEIQHDCWNFQKVLFLYVYSKTEIRIYNCLKKDNRKIEIIFNVSDINYQSNHTERKLKHLFFDFVN